MRIRWITALTAAFGLGTLLYPLSEAPAKAAAAGKLFDGQEKTLVFVGYSTSYRWPNILELMINRQFDDQVVYHVMNAASGGAPVGTWIAEPGTRDYQRSYERMLNDWFLPLPNRPDMKGRRRYPNVPAPTVAIVQQSLQRTSPIIQGPDDRENIEKGAAAMQKLVESLHADGVELIFITSPHLQIHPRTAGRARKIRLGRTAQPQDPLRLAWPGRMGSDSPTMA